MPQVTKKYKILFFDATIPLLGLTKILHTPIGMGSAALAAAVLSDPKFPQGGQRMTTTTTTF